MNETTELIMKQLNQKKVHANTHELGGGDEVDALKLKNYLSNGSVTAEKLDPALITSVNNVAVQMEFDKRGVNVQKFGAKGDGVTDDSAAFISAIAYAESQSKPDTSAGASGNNRGSISIFIPPGQYVITQSEALMRSSFTTRTGGLSINGAGKFITEIIFKPTVTNSYLLNNNDAWLHVDMSDIAFSCNDATSNFMKSTSTGGAQNYTFERCLWMGSWNYGFYLVGNNTNSEMSWYHCNFTGTWNKGVYVPKSTDTPAGSDQFLNYNFFSCNFEVSQGDFLHFEQGGNINIWGGSYIHYGTTAGTFFKLNGGAHAFGVQRFLCIGSRFEHRNLNSKLINCEWNDGNVSFINCDTSSQSFVSGASTFITATFKSSNQKMSSIKFDNCSLMGQHEYVVNSGSWGFPHNVTYENCEITGSLTAEGFIVYNLSGASSNNGGTPIIKFKNCRNISNDNTVVFDCTLGYKAAATGQLNSYSLSLKNPQGKMPSGGGTLEAWLPMNAIIKEIHFYLATGDRSSTSNTWVYGVQTNETTPTVLGTAAGGGVIPLSDGFSFHSNLFFVCDSDTKRHITLTTNAGVDQVASNMYIIIEYLA